MTDDVLQQVCLLALQRAPGEARTGPRLRAWLATVTRHLAGHVARSEFRRVRREQAAAQREALPSTVDIAAHREALRHLVGAVTALEEPYYSVIVARYFDGRPVAEIAALSGASNAAVRQQLSRARHKLRARLQSLLAGDQQGWLAAALPLAPVAAPLKHAAALRAAPTRSLFPHFGGSLVAKTAPALVAAIGVGLVVAGGILFLRAQDSAEAPEPVVVRAPPAASTPAGTDLQALPARARAEPSVLEVAPKVATAEQPATAPAADPLALPPVPAGKAWDGLFKLADDLAFGTITQERVVDLSFDLLAQLPADAMPQLANGYATYDLLDTPGLGKVQLSVDLQPPRDDATSGRAATFTIGATLDMQPGAYTGNSADRAESTTLQIAVSTDDRDGLKFISAVSQNMVVGNRELWSKMQSVGSIFPIGGTFQIASGSSTWRPITVEASGTGDTAGFLHKFGEPVEKAGKLGDPRTQLLGDVLTSRRRNVPH